jgi:hypothetical protein
MLRFISPLGCVLLVALVALAGCGGPYYRTAVGDADGVPVRIEITLSREFIKDLRQRGPVNRETVVYYHGFHNHWHGDYRHPRYGHPGYFSDPFWSNDVQWAGPAPTTINLLAGDGPGQGRLMRTDLAYGTNIISLGIRPKRVVTLTLQAYGGIEGWEEIATFTAAETPGQRVVIDVKEHPPQVTIYQPDGTVVSAVSAVPAVPAQQTPASVPAPETTTAPETPVTDKP